MPYIGYPWLSKNSLLCPLWYERTFYGAVVDSRCRYLCWMKSRCEATPSMESHAEGIFLMRKCSKAFELLMGYARATAISEEHYEYMKDCLCTYLATGYARICMLYRLDLEEDDFARLGLIPAGATEHARFFVYPSTHFILPDESLEERLPGMRALMRLSFKLFLPEVLSIYDFKLEFWNISVSLTELEEQGKMLHRVLSFEWYSRTEVPCREFSKFSTASTRYFVQGKVGSRSVEALPDTGADMCLISQNLASELGLRPILGTRKKIRLANKKSIKSPGMVKVLWSFAGESDIYTFNCWVLPHCVHDIILGRGFLNATQTLTTFKSRIESEVVCRPRSLRLQLVGGLGQQMQGYFNDQLTTAFPDTGSDVMLVSRAYARSLGVKIDHDPAGFLQIEFADGTTAWTSGVVRDVSWRIGMTEVSCDFYVLDDLCVDVVLSNDYLFEFNVFTECNHFFLDVGLEDEQEFSKLCNVRLISEYGQRLDLLEEEYLQDLTSPEAFGPEKIQRELARRDRIRDEIASLPEDKQVAARLSENERQRRWEELRRVHRDRWNTTTGATAQPNPTAGKRKSRWRKFRVLLASA